MPSLRFRLLMSVSMPALRLNDSLQRAFRHDALVTSGVIPKKLTGRQMDLV